MIHGALHAKGGQAWLEKQMAENANAFLALLGKTLPKDVTIENNTSLTINRERIDDANAGLKAALARVQGVADKPRAGGKVVH